MMNSATCLLYLTVTIFAFVEHASANCNAIQIISKKGWGAKAPKSPSRLATPVGRVFIHHTDGSSCGSQSACASVLRGIQTYHQNTRGWSDVGYNFLIGGDGKVYEGRGWTTLGAHTANNNGNAIGISFMGKYQNVAPSNAMLNAAKNLISCGISRNYIRSGYTLQGHRDVVATSCPGQRLYNIIKTWPKFIGKKSG